MKITVAMLLFVGLVVTVAVAAPRHSGKASANSSVAQEDANSDYMRAEGERRFRANCGRCHAAPQKLAPREMLTIERHMRVRAMVTADDMKYILSYVTQ